MKKTRIRLSLFSLVLALVLFGLTICATGREPFSVYWSILAGSFGSTKSFLNVLAYTLPLIMTGLGAAVAFQSGVFNIGGEGQVLVGGLAAVIVGLTIPLPAPWGWLLALLPALPPARCGRAAHAVRRTEPDLAVRGHHHDELHRRPAD